MKHIQPVSKTPDTAQTVTTDVFLTLIRDFLNVLIIFFTNKNPQNPVPIVPDGETDTGTDTGTDMGM